jgi:hypothetical protein
LWSGERVGEGGIPMECAALEIPAKTWVLVFLLSVPLLLL